VAGGEVRVGEHGAELEEVSWPRVFGEASDGWLVDGECGEHGAEILQALAQPGDADLDGADAGAEVRAHSSGGDDAAERHIVGDDKAGLSAGTEVDALEPLHQLVLRGGTQGADLGQIERAKADFVDSAEREIFRGTGEEGAAGDGTEAVKFPGHLGFAASLLADEEGGAEVGGDAPDLDAETLGERAVSGEDEAFKL
jgi:hypothetical protein